MLQEYRASKIGLNIHVIYGHKRRGKRGLNMRTFEIPAAGCFELVDHMEELNNFFAINKEIVTFSDEKDLLEKIAYYLENEKEREKIAEAGRRRVLKEHTYQHRMKVLLSTIE